MKRYCYFTWKVILCYLDRTKHTFEKRKKELAVIWHLKNLCLTHFPIIFWKYLKDFWKYIAISQEKSFCFIKTEWSRFLTNEIKNLLRFHNILKTFDFISHILLEVFEGFFENMLLFHMKNHLVLFRPDEAHFWETKSRTGFNLKKKTTTLKSFLTVSFSVFIGNFCCLCCLNQKKTTFDKKMKNWPCFENDLKNI